MRFWIHDEKIYSIIIKRNIKIGEIKIMYPIENKNDNLFYMQDMTKGKWRVFSSREEFIRFLAYPYEPWPFTRRTYEIKEQNFSDKNKKLLYHYRFGKGDTVYTVITPVYAWGYRFYDGKFRVIDILNYQDEILAYQNSGKPMNHPKKKRKKKQGRRRHTNYTFKRGLPKRVMQNALSKDNSEFIKPKERQACVKWVDENGVTRNSCSWKDQKKTKKPWGDRETIRRPVIEEEIVFLDTEDDFF